MTVPSFSEGSPAHLRIDVEGHVFAAVLFSPADPGRTAAETALDACGASIPAVDRVDWNVGPREIAFVLVRGSNDTPVLGFSVRGGASRVLPGYFIARIRRFGATPDPYALRAGIRAAAAWARRTPRLLRVHVELLIADPHVRSAVEAECRAQGFAPVPAARTYVETILIDLTPDVNGLLAGLSKTGRQNVRAVAKNPVAVRTIDDSRHATRLHDLLRETMGRTGGVHRAENWEAIIDYCRRRPDVARLVGLFDARSSAAEPLLAFALGLRHGAVVEYATAGSTRQTSLKIPLAYGLAWDLMLWGREHGARWFDFGGVTRGSVGDGDVLGGISDFKRYFSTNVVRVGSEFEFEPHFLAAVFARASRRLVEWARRSTEGVRRRVSRSSQAAQ